MRFALLVVIALAGCGKKQCHDCGGPAIQPSCDSAVPLTCATGMVDGCAKQLTTRHSCVAADAVAGAACEQQIQLTCPDGQSDGCLTGESSTHVCVAC